MVEDNKTQKLKKQLSIKEISRSIDLFLGKKQNGRKGTFAGKHFHLRKATIQHYFLLIKFSRISYTGLQLYSFLLFFQMLIKYLKINVLLHEWTTLSRLFFRHDFTSLFIVKGERFYDYFSMTIFLGKNSPTDPLGIPFSESHSF